MHPHGASRYSQTLEPLALVILFDRNLIVLLLLGGHISVRVVIGGLRGLLRRDEEVGLGASVTLDASNDDKTDQMPPRLDPSPPRSRMAGCRRRTSIHLPQDLAVEERSWVRARQEGGARQGGARVGDAVAGGDGRRVKVKVVTTRQEERRRRRGRRRGGGGAAGGEGR